MNPEDLNQIDDSSDIDGEVITPEQTEPEDRGDNLPEPAAEAGARHPWTAAPGARKKDGPPDSQRSAGC